MQIVNIYQTVVFSRFKGIIALHSLRDLHDDAGKGDDNL